MVALLTNIEDHSLTILTLYDERQILTLVQLGAILDLPPEELLERVDWLYRHNYLCIEPRYAQVVGGSTIGNQISLNTPLQITIDGQAAIQAHFRAEKQQKRDSIRYAITTAISVAAIIIALTALLAQLGLIQLPRMPVPQ